MNCLWRFAIGLLIATVSAAIGNIFPESGWLAGWCGGALYWTIVEK